MVYTLSFSAVLKLDLFSRPNVRKIPRKNV
jgi:hypothetical protein